MRSLRSRVEKLEKKVRPSQTPGESIKPCGDNDLGLSEGVAKLDRVSRMQVIDFFTSLESRANAYIREQRERGIPEPLPLTDEERKRKLTDFIDALKERDGRIQRGFPGGGIER